MSEISKYSPFSIEMTETGLYFVAARGRLISYLFKDKQICRDFCAALDRSYNRLEKRYSLMDYRASLENISISSDVDDV